MRAASAKRCRDAEDTCETGQKAPYGVVAASHGGCDDPVEVAGPEDHAGGGVGGLVLDAKASPHGVVRAGGDGGDEKGQDVGDGVDLAGNAHVEEDDGADEHAKEADEEEVANRVWVVIRE